MKKSIVNSIKMLLMLTVSMGIIYPILINVVGQLCFNDKANGSLYYKEEKIRGSFLLGQKFTSRAYFHPRPSVIDYNPMPSGASNLGLTSKVLFQQYEKRRKDISFDNSLRSGEQIPGDMLFASASGVDPHISKKSAYLQIPRIAEARNLSDGKISKLYNLVDSLTEYPQLGFLGEEVVNVLKLNIKLDEMKI